MDRPSRRTSITIDEAIANLMGYATGPIDLQPDPNSDCEEACDNIPDYDLDILVDEGDVLEGEYNLAKHEKRPPHEVAEKQAAIKRQQEIIDQSYGHRCAINDELNKGEKSALKVDRALTNPAYTFITLHSFHEWVKCREGAAGGQSGAVVPAGSRPAGPGDAAKPAPRTKLRDQEDAILAEIVNQKSDPTSLPRNEPGKPGIKADVRKALRGSPLFAGKTTFDRAWERLRKDRRIVEKA